MRGASHHTQDWSWRCPILTPKYVVVLLYISASEGIAAIQKGLQYYMSHTCITYTVSAFRYLLSQQLSNSDITVTRENGAEETIQVKKNLVF